MAPFEGCDGKAISAHTMSVGAMLRPISRDGHVYALKEKSLSEEGLPMDIRLRGIKDTSTFNGFCKKHDRELFSEIENKSFVCSRKQLFLFAYRAVCRESYLKRKQFEAFPTLEEMARIKGVTEEIQLSDFSATYLYGCSKGAADVEALKDRLDVLLSQESFGRLITTVVEFRGPLPFTSSFSYFPDFNFEGEELQDLSDFERELSTLIVTVFSTENKGYLLMSYEDSNNMAPKALVDSFIKQGDMFSALLWFIFCNTENFALSPSWYESLEERDRKLLMKSFVENTSPFGPVHNILQTNPITLPRSGEVSIFTI